MPLPRVYVETSVVSYLTARPHRDIVVAGHQQTTHEWWDMRRQSFELCVSQLVFKEAGAGDPVAAKERLQALDGLMLLPTTEAARDLAKKLVLAGALPPSAADDALHIAVAATSGIRYLLTWNCRHMANATMLPIVDATCRSNGVEPPRICTPEQLMQAMP